MLSKFFVICIFSILISIENSFLRTNTPKSFICYAPPKYQKIENIDHNPSCQSKKVNEYFNNFNSSEILNECLNKYNFLSIKGQHKFPEACLKKQRSEEVYNYYQNGFSNENIDQYYDMARFSTLLVLKNGEYDYVDKLYPNRGYLIASTAPIGNPEDITNTSQFQRDCEDFSSPYLQNKDCYSGNYKIDGKYNLDNTILNFYYNLKHYKVDYVIMLTNFYEIGDIPGCKCMIRADRYFDISNNGVFKIPKSDHFTNSGFSVISMTNDEELIEFKKLTKNFDENINNLIEFRRLIVTNEKGEIFYKINHVHFKGWTDHTVPTGKSKKLFFDIVSYVKEKLNKHQNVLVHCTRGIGRTGTLIGSILLSGLKRSIKLNLFKLIIGLRKNRSKFIYLANQIELILENMEKTSLD